MSSACAGGPFVPEKGRLLIIGQQRDVVDDYVKALRMVPAGLMGYTSTQRMEGVLAAADHGAGIQHLQYFVDKYPDTALQIGLYMRKDLDQVLKGHRDENIALLGQWLMGTGRPVYLRIGYEFDLPDNHYDPLQYQAAYRYIVDRLRSQGVTNVAYVWHSAVTFDNPGRYLDWYPGDDYVDWFGISFFNPQQTRVAEDFFRLGREHKKPLMIAESTPAGVYSLRSKKEWFRHFFDLIRRNDVKAVSYINSSWDDLPVFKAMHWGDARVQADPELKELWLNEIRKDFLYSSRLLFQKIAASQMDLKRH